MLKSSKIKLCVASFQFSFEMLALRFHPGEEEFILEEKVTIPKVENDDDVLVKVEYAGMCGTDIHIVQGNFLKNLFTFRKYIFSR